MSATKNWMMAVEETFWDCVDDIMKQSSTLNEAIERSVSLGKPMVPHISESQIDEAVSEMYTHG